MASSAEGSLKKRVPLVDTVDPTLMPPPFLNPYLRLFIYIYYILISGSIYWGWNGFQQILYKAGAFEDVCGPADKLTKLVGDTKFIDCPDRAAGINNLYTLAYSTHFICSFVGGLLLDQFGPRICFLVGHAFTGVSYLMVFCFPKYKLLLRVSFVCIGMFCEACYVPCLSVNTYFPKGNSTIMAIMGSCRSLSFFVPTILASIYKNESVSREMIAVIGGVYLLLANFACFITGAFIIPKVVPIAPSADAPSEVTKESGAALDTAAPVEDQPLNILCNVKRALKSKMCLEFFLLVCCASLFVPSIEFVNKAQTNLLIASGEGGDATPVFAIFNVLTFVPAPLFGALMDKLGPAIVMHILHLCTALVYFCSSFDLYAMKIGACCWFILAGSLCISTTYCYVNKRFPPTYFGTLVSIVFVVAGSMTLTNIPVYNFGLTLKSDIPERQFRPLAFLFMGYMILASAISACLVYLSCFRDKRKCLPETNES